MLASQSRDLTLWKSVPYHHHPNNTLEFSSVSGGVFYVGDAGDSHGASTGAVLGVIVSLALVVGVSCYVLRQKRTRYSNVAKC